MALEEDFRPRVGHMRDRGARSRTFVAQVLRAAVRAGYVQRGGRAGRRPAGRGRAFALAASLRSPGRRVIVKARIVRQVGRSWRAAPLRAHLSYLKRDGVDRTGASGQMFDAQGDADERAFAARCEADRHHFRFIVSPEDAAELQDLRAYTRELMRRAEADLGTRLDWVAVDHWNTPHPHVHLLVRGKDDRGDDLVIDRDWIAHGFRARAEALASLELGPRSAREVAAALERETVAERWTGLDRLLLAVASEGRLDLRPGPGGPDPELRALLIGRAVTLERLGLAAAEGPAVWRLCSDLRERLAALRERGGIIATLHRAARGERSLADLSVDPDLAAVAVVGRVVERGLHDELSGRAFVVIDGVDGRLHHLRLPDIAAAGDTPVGGVVEARVADGQVRLVHRSDMDLPAQVGASGATWLDRQLVAREPLCLADRGFGAEVRSALVARQERLVLEGYAVRDAGGRVRFAAGMLAALRLRDLAAAGARLARETGLRFEPEPDGPEVRGSYGRRVDLASGRFAMIEDGLGFRLVPWARLLDRRLGQEVSGRVSERGVDWDLGRSRGRER